MDPQTLLDYRAASPFKPFRVVMNNGRAYDVRHPDLLAVGEDVAIFYFKQNPTGPFNRWETFSLSLINHIEQIGPGKPAKPKKGS
jgi:hypothetical protein